MSSYYGSLVTLSLISDDYICWESSAYVLLPSHSVNFPSPVILIRHRMTHVPAAQHMWECSNSQAKSIVLYGVYQLLGPWLNTFLILPFKIDLNTLYLFLLCFLLFFLPSFLLSFLLHSESPSLFLPFLLPLFLSFAQHFSDLKCRKQRSWSNRLSMFAQLIKLTHNVNTRNNCNTNISINIPTPG